MSVEQQRPDAPDDPIRKSPADVLTALCEAEGAGDRSPAIARRIIAALARARYRIVEDRSKDEHNLLFGVIGMAADNWPEAHSFQPIDAEELRAWLLIEAGHCEAMSAPRIIGTDIKALVDVGKFFCRGSRHFRLKQQADGIVILRPRSIDGTLPVKEFRAVAASVYEIIGNVTGITPEMYKAWKDKAA